MSTNELLYRVLLRHDGKATGMPIMDAVCQVTGTTPEQLKGKSRQEELVEARQIAMFFMLQQGHRVKWTGRQFNRDHATAIHARNRIKQLYGQKCERVLTERVDKVADLTGIRM